MPNVLTTKEYKKLTERFTDLTKAVMVVMSHLSDAQEEISTNAINHRLDFVKYIILQCEGDLTKYINVDAMYEVFNNKQK
jgi:hypothetical protein